MERSAEGQALAVLAKYIENEVHQNLADRDVTAALKEWGERLCVPPADMARGNVIGMLLSALLDELNLSGEQRLACRDVIAAAIDEDRAWMSKARCRRGALQ